MNDLNDLKTKIKSDIFFLKVHLKKEAFQRYQSVEDRELQTMMTQKDMGMTDLIADNISDMVITRIDRYKKTRVESGFIRFLNWVYAFQKKRMPRWVHISLALLLNALVVLYAFLPEPIRQSLLLPITALFIIGAYHIGDAVIKLINTVLFRKKIIERNQIKCAYLFPNNMVVAFDFADEQIPSLSGPYTEDLHAQIIKHQTEVSVLEGFPEININEEMIK